MWVRLHDGRSGAAIDGWMDGWVGQGFSPEVLLRETLLQSVQIPLILLGQTLLLDLIVPGHSLEVSRVTILDRLQRRFDLFFSSEFLLFFEILQPIV